MIYISLTAEEGKSVTVSANGHSGAAESGNDIICAAVSALVQTAYLAIKDLGAEVKMSRCKNDASFKFTVVRDGINDHDTDVIIKAMVVGLKDLSSGYPHNIKLEV